MDKTNNRFAASRKHIPGKERSCADSGQIETEIGLLITGQLKLQKPSFSSLSLSVTLNFFQGGRPKSRVAANRAEESCRGGEQESQRDACRTVKQYRIHKKNALSESLQKLYPHFWIMGSTRHFVGKMHGEETS